MNSKASKIFGLLSVGTGLGRVRRLSLSGLLGLSISILGGCSESDLKSVSQDGKGAISLGIAFDSKTMEAAATKAAAVDYSVTVRDAENKRIRLWSSANEVPEEIWLLSGNYKVEVEAGANSVAAFDSPYYVGSEDISIEPEMISQQEVVCTLANAKVSVKYSDRIKNNFVSYVTEVGPEGKRLKFDDESKIGFYKTVAGAEATELQWNLAITNGAGNLFTQNGMFNVEPRKHYILEVDIESTEASEGGMTFLTNVTVSEDAVLVEDEIKVPIKRLPEITGVGYDIAIDYFIPYENRPQVQVNLLGTPKIDSVGLAHDCAYFTIKGIPENFDLFGEEAVGDGAKNQLNSLGLEWTMDGDGKNMVVNFTELIKNLPEGVFHFEFGVKDTAGKRTSKVLTLLIMDSDVITVSPTVNMDAWGNCLILRGRWVTADNPGQLAFEYQKDGEADWTKISDGIVIDNALTGDYSLRLKGLTPNTKYNYRAIAAKGMPKGEQTMTTESILQIPDLNFDEWTKQDNAWMPTSATGLSTGSYWFDSGNLGTSSSLGGNKNPTEPEYTDVYAGAAAARMYSTTVTLGKFAAGNIYTGRFNKITISPMGAELDFGRPYTARPTKLRGYFKYIPAAVTHTHASVPLSAGDMDYCNIHIALCDWSGPFAASTGAERFPDWNGSDMLAYGAFSTNETVSEYTYFEIDIDWRNFSKKPTYIVIAASASKYGDYFAGGEGSVLLIDELELAFD